MIEQKIAYQLPIEIVLSILECSLVSETWGSRALQLKQTLLISRTIHKSLVKLAYSTVVLKSVGAVSLFCETLEAKSHLSGHIENLWVASSQLHHFDVSDYPFGFVETKILFILSAAGNLKRVAVPYAYFPRTGFPGTTHLSTTNNLFPPLTPFLHLLQSLYIYGLPGRNCVNTIVSRFGAVQHISISVPPTPGADASEVSLLCARMVMLFRQRLAKMTKLELAVDGGVSAMLRTGMRKTLEEDGRIFVCERDWEMGWEEELLYDTWLRDCQWSK
jgi:hypothetical protein